MNVYLACCGCTREEVCKYKDVLKKTSEALEILYDLGGEMPNLTIQCDLIQTAY